MPARILVIEDNPTNLELMVYLLSAYGYEPLTAIDGVEGVEAAVRERPDLIVCDVQLPKADGFEVVRTLKARREFQRIPVIAVTALAMVGDRERLLGAGFDGYIAKPIGPENFVSQVEAFLPAELRSIARKSAPWGKTSAEARPERRANATVLVLDDTVANRELLRSILEPHGYRVVTAATIAEAEDEVSRAAPDLIIADVHLRDGTSLDFIAVLRGNERYQRLPVLIQSASAEDLERDGLAALPGIKLLPRPMDTEHLLQEVETALLEASQENSCR